MTHSVAMECDDRSDTSTWRLFGYVKEYHVEATHARCQKSLKIYEGTSEIQKIVISEDLR